MGTLWFDIEADGLLETVTKIHCIVTVDEQDRVCSYVGGGVEAGVEALMAADTIVAHHALGYDLPVIEKFFGANLAEHAKVFDTLVASRIVWPDMRELDYGRVNAHPEFPKELIGRHSLEAWGARLGFEKGEKPDFIHFSQDMLEYCIRDVHLLKRVHKEILSKEGYMSEAAFKMEHMFAWLMLKQEEHGFLFDLDAAEKLNIDLLGKKYELEELAKAAFPPKVVQLKTKEKIIPFNPGSRMMIAEGFTNKYGWKPTEFTPDGRARIDEPILKGMDYPEAAVLLEYLLVQKRIAQLATGPQAWIGHQQKDGRIHGRVNPIGAVTSRCAHSRPNIGQVPAVGSPYGRECRSLFIVPEGMRLVGADASGLELRCLAHYLHAFDGGKFMNELLKGDIHMANAKAAGLDKLPNGRDLSKTMIYCFLYGGGPEKLGAIVGGGRKEGMALRKRFLSKSPALKILRERVTEKAKRDKCLTAIDGRRVPIRHTHAALNTLLQSAGAILVKNATCLLYANLEAQGLILGEDYSFVAHIHDEIQLEAREGIDDFVGQQAVKAIREAGEAYSFKCPLDAEYKSGLNWSETH